MIVKAKRLMAALIDFVIICFISSSFVGVITRGEFNVTPFSAAVYVSTCLFFLLFRDAFCKKNSLGKRLLRLRVTTTDGSQLTILDVIKRNMPILLLMPLEILLIMVDNHRIGDVWTRTTVVCISRTYPDT